jgi:hypothetical protein
MRLKRFRISMVMAMNLPGENGRKRVLVVCRIDRQSQGGVNMPHPARISTGKVPIPDFSDRKFVRNLINLNCEPEGGAIS